MCWLYLELRKQYQDFRMEKSSCKNRIRIGIEVLGYWKTHFSIFGIAKRILK